MEIVNSKDNRALGSGEHTFSVRCPHCGMEYSHLQDSPLSKSFTDTDESSDIWVELSLRCENGHYWSLAVGNCKGEMRLELVPAHVTSYLKELQPKQSTRELVTVI